jgi:hypothetical protein
MRAYLACVFECFVTAVGYWAALALLIAIGAFVAALLATTGPITAAVVSGAAAGGGIVGLKCLLAAAGGSLLGCIVSCF